MKIVAIELIFDASDATIAATSAANTRPRMPVGSSVIMVGYAWSGRSRSGASTTAAMPGSTTITGISSFRNAANTTPFCASRMSFAASARWMMYWLKPQ